MPRSISSVVADDGYNDGDDEMPDLVEEWIPPAEAVAEQAAIWDAIKEANRVQSQSTDRAIDKTATGTSSAPNATDPTPNRNPAGSSRVDVNANLVLTTVLLQTLQSFKFDFSFPMTNNSPASSNTSDIRGLGVETAEESHASSDNENNELPPIQLINTEQTQEPVFHLFRYLPDPVRLKIWNLNLPEPRLIEIVGSKNDRFYGKGFGVVNLQVCRESRVETLKTYPLSFSVNYDKPIVPFCFEKDTLLLGRRLERHALLLGARVVYEENSHIYFRKHCNRGDLGKVERLVVDAALCWMVDEEEMEELAKKEEGSNLQRPRRDRGTALGGLSRTLFSGVREYTALYNEDTDPLPEWAKPEWYPLVPSFPWQRTNNTQWESQYQILQTNWNKYEFGGPPNWHELTPQWAEHARYGCVDRHKWDPAIKRWVMPRISSLGLKRAVVDGLYNSGRAPWPFLLVHRAIGDLFD